MCVGVRCVCQGCVLIRETGVCPWAAAEGQENLVVWESSGWDKSGRPAKHPLPRRVDALKSARSHAHTPRTHPVRTHTYASQVLAPFLLAGDTMVTEQPASPCVPWPSRSSLKAKLPLALLLGDGGRQGRGGQIEKGSMRWSGRSRGRLRGK